MKWSHVAVAIIAAAVFYYLGSKYPGVLTKVTAGTVQA